MSVMASQITSLSIVYSTIYSGADQRKRQSSTSLAFVHGINRSPVNFLHKRASNAEKVSIWWRHHEIILPRFAKMIEWAECCILTVTLFVYDNVMSWIHFLNYWHFARGIHQLLLVSPHKRLVIQSFDVFIVDSMNKLLNKQLTCQWSMPSLQCNCNDNMHSTEMNVHHTELHVPDWRRWKPKNCQNDSFWHLLWW